MAVHTPLVALLALGLVLPPAAQAQCLLCPATNPTGATGQPARPEPRALSLTVTTDLDFSRVTTGPGGGAVDVDPATASRVTQGSVVNLGGMPFSGRVEVRGEPGAVVRITLPARIVLDGDTGGQVMVTDLRTDLPSLTRIGGDGTLVFRFGGRMTVAGDQEGTFRGRIPITADYL